eukprot:TRINITY_DN1433_c0_g1_i5.p1 TRINITY_DN1433_c0_g1~~TRINITY_DN1433_c0_g1_i5.p1  ORF type:complete len:226 (-),score=34.45 TRINITY_DN1433_c0_g1_i5:46-723(-)
MCIRDSPNIVRFKGYYVKYGQQDEHSSKGTFCIFMETLSNSFQSELTNRILQSKEFDTKELTHLFNCTIEGLAYIHSKNINHLNIKATNILLKKKDTGSISWTNLPEIKLSDIIHERRRQTISKAESVYIAPEVYIFFANDQFPIDWGKVDVYALGVILLQALCLDDMKNTKLDQQLVDDILQSQYHKHPELCDILRDMLTVFPEDRLSSEQVKEKYSNKLQAFS